MAEGKRLPQILGEREALLVLQHKNSESEHRRFLRFNNIQRNLAVLICVSAVMVGAGIAAAVYGGFVAGTTLILSAALLPVFLLVLSYGLAKRYIRKNSWYLEYTDTYKFYDDYMYIKTDNGKHYSESITHYEALYRVYETKTNLYVYLSKTRAIIIEKGGMSEEDAELFYRLLAGKTSPWRIRAGFFGIRRKMKRLRKGE